MLRWDLVVRVERENIVWTVDGTVLNREFPRCLLLMSVGDDENAVVSVIASVIMARTKSVFWIANNVVAIEPLLEDILLYRCS